MMRSLPAGKLFAKSLPCPIVIVMVWASVVFIAHTGCSQPDLRRSSGKIPGDQPLEQHAYELVERGDYPTAIKMLNDILRQDRSNARAMYILGYVHGQLGEVENEIDYYEAAIQAGYRSDQVFHNLGQAYLETNQSLQAIQSFENGLVLNPDNADNHFGLGMAYSSASEYDKAEREILKAIELEPEAPEFREYLGRLYEDVGQLEKAAAQFRNILEISPEYPGAREYLDHIEKRRFLRDNR